MPRNDQILVSSIHKAIQKAKTYGKFKSEEIYTFYILSYYINFTQETINNGYDNYIEANKILKQCIRMFAHSNPNEICDYLLTVYPRPTLYDFRASNYIIRISTTDIKISQLQILN